MSKTKPKKNTPWNKGKFPGRKPPLSPDQVSVIRMMLSQRGNIRDMAMFSLAIDSSLRGCDLVALNVSDVMLGDVARDRVTIQQKKTKERVTFSMTDYTRVAIRDLVREEDKSFTDPLFASQKGKYTGKRITVNWYRNLVKQWISLARLDPALYGSHSLRRTRVAHIYRKTGNLKVAQLLLGHKNIEMTANYLGIEEEQALGIAEQFEI